MKNKISENWLSVIQLKAAIARADICNWLGNVEIRTCGSHCLTSGRMGSSVGLGNVVRVSAGVMQASAAPKAELC